MTTEELLADYIATGSNDSFAEIVARTQGYLSAVMFRYVRDNDIAADLVQETYLSLHLNCQRFGGRSSLRTWLTSIAVNLAISKLRKANRREKPSDCQDITDHLEGTRELRRGIVHLCQRAGGDPAYAAERKESCQRIREALTHLSAENARVVEMVHGWDEKYDSVAKILGIPIGTVRSKQNRALAQLRKLVAA